MRLTVLIVSMATMAGLLVPAVGSAADVTVPANRESMIGYMTGIADNCHNAGKPKMDVAREPAHGAVRFQWMKRKIDRKTSVCNGRAVWGMAVFFKPDAGYRGKDAFSVGMHMQAYVNSTGIRYIKENVSIVVK